MNLNLSPGPSTSTNSSRQIPYRQQQHYQEIRGVDVGAQDNLAYEVIDGTATLVHNPSDERISLSSNDTPTSCSQKATKQLKKRLPILQWFPTYKKGQLLADMISGVTVGLTVVPQSMAYAAIAGLTPEYGLYSSYIGCILYVIFGSCRQVTIGPTAVMGLLTFETCGSDFAACAILTGFYSGVFELAMAFLQLGWVVSFISEPVVVGFTAGAATTIISSQVKNFLGLSGPKGSSSGFLGYWEAVFKSISTISLQDTILGVSSFTVLLLLRQLKECTFSQTPRGKTFKKICWLISVSRNVIIVLATTLLAYFWSGLPFKLTGKVLGGFPPVGPPEFNLPTNSTSEDYHSFLGTWSILGAGPLVVALISVLQNVAISKAFGNGQSVDATQEMFALGLSNIVGSFFSAIPISGSFSRSAVNEASGVQSPLGGLFTGTLVLLSLGFLTPTFYYIPKASLAAVIISAVMFMIEFQALGVMWKINRMDMVSCLVTFLCSIFIGMEYGIMIGVGISLTILLMKSLKPSLSPELLVDVTGIQYVFTKPSPGLSFPSVDFVRSSLLKLVGKFPSVSVIVISFEMWTHFDYTCVTAIASLVKTLRKEGKHLIFVDCDQSWINALESAGLKDVPHTSFYELGDYLRKMKWGRITIEGINDGATTTESANQSQNQKSPKPNVSNVNVRSPVKRKNEDYGSLAVVLDVGGDGDNENLNDSQVVNESDKPLL